MTHDQFIISAAPSPEPPTTMREHDVAIAIHTKCDQMRMLQREIEDFKAKCQHDQSRGTTAYCRACGERLK